MSEKNYDGFLKELTELSKKYGIYIDGCGCCGSPRLEEEEPEVNDGRLYWNSDSRKYSHY